MATASFTKTSGRRWPSYVFILLLLFWGGRGQGSGVRGQGSGVRGQGSGVRGQGSGVRGQGLGVGV